MIKQTIQKYIEGTANEAECAEVLSWIAESDENASYFAEQKNLWVQLHLPTDRAGDEDYKAIMAKIGRSRSRSLVRYMQRIAAILFIPLLAGALFLLLDRPSTVEKSDIAQHVYYTNKGVKGIVELPDGTKVWLNSDSRIDYPQQFSGKYRKVKFSGEGYFEVTHDPKHPMQIEMEKGLSVEVKGTSFNLCSYSNDPDVVATLVSGSIALHSSGGKMVDMKPNQRLKVTADKQFQLSQKDDVSLSYAWKDGWLIFDNTPMPDVIRRLERWYGVSFVVKNQDLLKYSFTARFNSESISQVMDLLSLSLNMRYSIKDSVITLFSL